MLYIIDTADRDEIRRLNEYYPIDGVTTNPTIISKEHSDFLKLVKDIHDIIGPDKMFHIQATGDTCDEIVKEARLLRTHVGGNLYVKIPISRDGLKATQILKKRVSTLLLQQFSHSSRHSLPQRQVLILLLLTLTDLITS